MLRPWPKFGRLLVLAGVLAGAGCDVPRGQWTKAGATESQRAQDLRICDETAAQWGAAPYFDPRRGQIVSNPPDASQTQAACMMRRGWILSP